MTSTKTPSKDWWLNSLLADEDLMVMSEVASTLGVATITVRRLLGKEGIQAPSKYYERGGYKVYLYTPEDVQELREHFYKRVRSRIAASK